MAFTGWLDDQRRAGPFDALIVSLLPSSREPSAMSPAAREGGGSWNLRRNAMADEKAKGGEGALHVVCEQLKLPDGMNERCGR